MVKLCPEVAGLEVIYLKLSENRRTNRENHRTITFDLVRYVEPTKASFRGCKDISYELL